MNDSTRLWMKYLGLAVGGPALVTLVLYFFMSTRTPPSPSGSPGTAGRVGPYGAMPSEGTPPVTRQLKGTYVNDSSPYDSYTLNGDGTGTLHSPRDQPPYDNVPITYGLYGQAISISIPDLLPGEKSAAITFSGTVSADGESFTLEGMLTYRRSP